MTDIATNSYGSTAGIAAITPRRSNGSGDFDGTTNPTEPVLVTWIDQISAEINTLFADEGFDIPIEQADCVLVIDKFVNTTAAAMVEGVNGSGRFGPTTKDKRAGKSRHTLLAESIMNFVEEKARGFEALGATRSRSVIDSVAVKTRDRSGSRIYPIMQRKQFGNTFENWDSD